MTKKAASWMPPNYFVCLHPVILIMGAVIPAGFLVTVVMPNSIPASLGPLATGMSYLGNNYGTWISLMLKIVMAVHIGEGLVAVGLCLKYGLSSETMLKWFSQTLVYGFFSLKKLLYPPKSFSPKKKNK